MLLFDRENSSEVKILHGSSVLTISSFFLFKQVGEENEQEHLLLLLAVTEAVCF